jgi:hypothetical protein
MYKVNRLVSCENRNKKSFQSINLFYRAVFGKVSVISRAPEVAAWNAFKELDKR